MAKIKVIFCFLFCFYFYSSIARTHENRYKPMKLKNAVGINFSQLQAFMCLGVFESTFSFDEELIHSYNLIPDAGLSVSKLF